MPILIYINQCIIWVRASAVYCFCKTCVDKILSRSKLVDKQWYCLAKCKLGIKIRYLIHDRDTKYSSRFQAFWTSEHVKSIRTPVRTPVANSYVECYIGKAKRECLNHFFCVSLDQLDYINREWLAYYNEQRPHQGTDIGNKILRPDFTPTDKGEIKREQRLGGVISYYYREAA